jgi:hypothetical protein
MKREVFNNSIGSPYVFSYPKLTDEQEKQVLAGLFEQLLIFDKVIISTNRVNFALYFLIKTIGINSVERLLENDYIKILVWTPVIVAASGRKQDDGTIDESTIYGKPPIAAGALTDDDFDPEKNIHKALSYFNLNRDRKRIFAKTAIKNYIIPNGMEFSTESANYIINAYKNNNLAGLGLPYGKEPNQMDMKERRLLLEFGHKVLETSILSKYQLKSYENYEHFKICQQNIENIGKAFNISGNSGVLFKLESLPNLKELYLQERLDFDSVFRIRHLTNAKFYRKWINEVGENCNAQEITKEYLNEIKGNNKFFESSEGKFLKTLGLFGINALLGAELVGIAGAATGLALGFFETFWLDNILKGRNPSMFIKEVQKEIDKK